MDATMTQDRAEASTPLPHRRGFRRSVWPVVWPAALGVLVAAGTAYGLTDGREVASIVAASGLVYVAAAAVGRRWAAWAAFGVTFVLLGLDKLTGLDATLAMVVLAGVLVIAGLAARRTRPWWALPLQTAAMLVLGAIALGAVWLEPTAGGLIIAGALLAHAAWDVYHHRADRVVDRPFAVFCAVLDVLVAVVIGVVALTA